MEATSGGRGARVAALFGLLVVAGASPTLTPGHGAVQEAGTAGSDRVTVPAGTRLVAALEDSLSTGRTEVGEPLSASVVRPVTVPEGVAVPLGAIVHLTPVRLEPSRSMNDPTVIRIRFDSLTVRGEARPIQATLTSARSSKSSRTGLPISIAWMVAAAAVGALAGRWLTGGKGAMTGAALGAIAAAVVIMTTQDVDAVVPAGSEIELRLDEPVDVRAP